MIKNGFILIAFIFLSCSLFSQNIKTYINSDKIPMDGRLVLTLEVKGSRNASTPRFPRISGFQAGGVSTRTQFINRTVSASFSRTYYPTKEGSFTIPSFSHKIGNQNYQSPSFKVKVTKADGRSRQQQGNRRNPFDDFFKDPFFGDPHQQNRSKPKQLTFQSVVADYFLAVNTNKEECYLGEQVLGEVVLYINQRDQGKIQVGPSEIGEMQQRIKNDAFWEEIIEFLEIPVKRVRIKNKNYLAYTLYRTVLFPIQTGEIPFKNVWLDAKKLSVATNASPFDQFFMNTSKYEPIKVYAGTKTLSVKHLPDTDLPNANSVGKFKLKASLSQHKVNTGEPLTLKVNIKGNGNTNLLPEAHIPFPASFDVYEPSTNISTHKSENVLFGEKDFEYTFVPTEPGIFNLGPIKFYYFDNRKNIYDSLLVADLPIEVSGDPLKDMVLQGSSLDRFYTKALDEASETTPSEVPFKRGIFIACLALLLGSVAYKGFIVRRKEEKER